MREKWVGCLLAGGALMSFCSLPLMWMFAVSGVFRGTYTRTPVTNEITDAGTLNLVPLMIAVFAVGLLLMGAAVFYGLVYSKRLNRGPRQTVADAFILSRYAMSPHGDLLSDWDLEGTDDPRFYVRMRLPGGRAGEYPVAAETYFNCAEGAYGEVELQGRWVGRFTPYIGDRPTS